MLAEIFGLIHCIVNSKGVWGGAQPPPQTIPPHSTTSASRPLSEIQNTPLLRGHSRSLKLLPFESMAAVSYSPSIVTLAYL